METMDRSGKIGTAILFVFATPFALFGLWALGQAWQQLMAPSGNTPFWYPLIFGAVFSAIGFGLMSAVFFGSKRYKKQLRVQAEHPSEPWLWRADWADGRVKSNTRGSMIGAWIFAIFWNIVSMPIAFLALPNAVRQKGPGIWIALIFPVAGVFLLIRAIRQSVAYAEFGKTWFAMASVPAVIGRDLKGTIEARFPHSPDHGVHLRLSCVHKVTTGSGDSRTTHETILWQDEADLNSAQLCPGPVGTTIPVAFHIPLDAHPTEKINPRDEYLWLLEALADVPGVNYHDIFEVPVFRTAATPTPEEEKTIEQTREFAAARASALERPMQLTVEVQQTPEGTEFFFPAARNRSFAASLTTFAAIFSGITWFVVRPGVPRIFPLAFGFFSLLLIYSAIKMWLGTTRVVIGNSLNLQDGLLGGGKVQQIAFSDISSIDDTIKSQQGGATGTPYYDITLTRKDGKTVTLGRTLPSKHEAEWLVGEMRRLASLQPRGAAAAASNS